MEAEWLALHLHREKETEHVVGQLPWPIESAAVVALQHGVIVFDHARQLQLVCRRRVVQLVAVEVQRGWQNPQSAEELRAMERVFGEHAPVETSRF